MERQEYEMTQEQLDKILDACKPTPAMFLSGGRPMFSTPQENANHAWQLLGDELGFDHMTVRPNGKGDRYFTAVPKAISEKQKLLNQIRKAENDLAEINSNVARLERSVRERSAEVDGLRKQLSVLEEDREREEANNESA